MSSVEFEQAFYIKLGPKGTWEEDSLTSGRLRFGWSGQTVQDINARQWGLIAEQLRTEHQRKPSQVATTDFNRLQDIAESGPEDIWITFSQAKLWWARLRDDLVEQDGISKFRRTARAWSDRAINGRVLFASELPGKIAQLQSFRGTVCRVRYPDLLKRVLVGARSPLAEALAVQRSDLSKTIAEAIRELHWKDYETLVDLVFQRSGWVRLGVLGPGLRTKLGDGIRGPMPVPLRGHSTVESPPGMTGKLIENVSDTARWGAFHLWRLRNPLHRFSFGRTVGIA